MDISQFPPAVRSILDPHVVTVVLDTPLVDIIQYLSQIGEDKAQCVLVTNESGITGIVTPSDAVRLMGENKAISQLKLTDVMTQPVITLPEPELQDPLFALAMLNQRHIHHLPIVNPQGQPTAVISSRSAKQGLQFPHLLKLYRVADILSPLPIQASQHLSALDLARQMTQHQVSCIVITKQAGCDSSTPSIPIGVVTIQSLLQVWITGADLSQVTAEKLMNSEFSQVNPSDSMWLAAQEMKRVPYLVVTDSKDCLVGLLAECNLLQILNPAQMNKSVRQLQRSLQQLRSEKTEFLQNHTLELERLVQTRTAQMTELYEQLQNELAERKQAEAALQKANEELEIRVQERTREWQQVTERLLNEIAERNRLDQEARQAQDQLQAVLDAVPGLVSWISADLTYLGVNRQLAANFDRTPESFVGQPVGFMNQSSEFRQFLEEFFAGSAQTGVREICFEDLGQRHRYLMVVQKYNQNRAAVSVGINITDWKRAEQDLETSEAKFRNLVEQTNDWVWEIDEQLKFTYVNPRVENITGYTVDDVLQKRIFDFMPEDEAVRFTTLLQYVVAERGSFSQIETTLRHRAGHPIVLEFSGSPVFDQQGQWQGYRGITRDITERKQVERNIRKALTKEKELSELKTRFISMASHEFRTPLTTILASAECLEHYHNKWPEEKKLVSLQRIQGAAKHMTELLNDVLILGRADTGKAKLKPAWLNLEEFCADLVEELQLGQSDIQRLLFTSTETKQEAWVDEKLLRHILINLLSNALKYSPESSSVDFHLNYEGGYAIFSIQDHGIGIPPEEHACLFEPFHRANNVGKISGTGLGLAIVKKAVEAHGGTINFKSIVGKGTTFTVRIPVEPTPR